MLKYKGYLGRVEFDAEAKLLHGDVLGTRDVITFGADSAADIEKAFQASVDDYLAFCAERGEPPEKPASGKLLLRLSPTLHRDVDQMAHAEGRSINAWVQEAIQKKRDQFWAALMKSSTDKAVTEPHKKRARRRRQPA